MSVQTWLDIATNNEFAAYLFLKLASAFFRRSANSKLQDYWHSWP